MKPRLRSRFELHPVSDADKLTQIKVGATTIKSYTYDTAGRTTAVTTSAGTTNLTYDYESRVTQITYPSTATNTFTYNGLDTRVGKVDSAGTATYKRDGDSVTAPVLDDGAAKFTPGISERRGTTSRFSHPDRMGSVTRHTSASQGSAASRQYDAFGNVAAVSGTWTGPFGFAGNWGYQEDGDSGLQLLGHRYYDPSTGRFLTRDPIKDGRNWYTYCENNPLTAVDPDGLDRLLLYENPGGVGMGSHLIIGLEDSNGNKSFYGFYPSPPASGGGSSGSSSSSSGGAATGPGYVNPKDKPKKRAKVSAVDITPAEREKIEAAIRRKPMPYSVNGHNCADWAADVIEEGTGNERPPRKSSPLYVTTPRSIREWIETWH
ncbi:MAG: RHS repeat-associated core domain-containing protein [Fimbriimonadaceae bacterium]|nr:RHS repeat-associated core domain-containing protein [Fimbriimonadaceae bacterium]